MPGFQACRSLKKKYFVVFISLTYFPPSQLGRQLLVVQTASPAELHTQVLHSNKKEAPGLQEKDEEEEGEEEDEEEEKEDVEQVSEQCPQLLVTRLPLVKVAVAHHGERESVVVH